MLRILFIQSIGVRQQSIWCFMSNLFLHSLVFFVDLDDKKWSTKSAKYVRRSFDCLFSCKGFDFIISFLIFSIELLCNNEKQNKNNSFNNIFIVLLRLLRRFHSVASYHQDYSICFDHWILHRQYRRILLA